MGPNSRYLFANEMTSMTLPVIMEQFISLRNIVQPKNTPHHLYQFCVVPDYLQCLATVSFNTSVMNMY